jgi:5-methyltetrahydropteroyltriglutamate--homocysteine methyltransferase
MKIRTTHVGSLPGPPEFDPSIAPTDDDLRRTVRWVVDEQRSIGLDIINEGELTKGGDWLAFMDDRLGGFEERPAPASGSILLTGKDREQFADFYRYASERQMLFFVADQRMRTTRRHLRCTAPITYTGTSALQRQIDAFRSVVDDPADCFFTSTAPASLEPYRSNEFYPDEESFVSALAEALRVEYETIANAGFLLQIDDAWLVALWDRIGIEMGLTAFTERCIARVELLNHALRNIPEDRIRYHLCWGSWHGPHAYDLPLADIVDVVLRVRARFYSFEAANVRHEHEYHVWERAALPASKVLLPGVITHSTDLVEHPELVAERIRRFVRIVDPSASSPAQTADSADERIHKSHGRSWRHSVRVRDSSVSCDFGGQRYGG